MAKVFRSLLLLSLLITSSFSPIFAQPCSTHQFQDQKTSFAACYDLPVLNSTIYWNYFPSNATVDLAFRTTLIGDSKWTAWAINPNSKGMLGSQALVAFQKPDGSMAVYTSNIESYDTSLEQGNVTFHVYNFSAVQKENKITIFANLGLPNNVTTINQLWQQGPLDGDKPGMHAISGPNLKSYGVLDFISGKVQATSTQQPLISSMKIFHGILNTVSWGILLPIGTIVAHNLKGFDPQWFWVHVFLQVLGSLGGIGGWVTGHMLGTNSHKGHKCIGLTLLTLVILQLLVGGALRPKRDAKYRWVWNLFHYVVGYTAIVLGIVNIFKGFGILDNLGVPKWVRLTFEIVLAFEVVVGVLAAGFTYWKNKKIPVEKKQAELMGDELV